MKKQIPCFTTHESDIDKFFDMLKVHTKHSINC